MTGPGYLLGIDVGSSSVKASLVDSSTGTRISSAQSPAQEMSMLALRPGWAEQEPELWWSHVVQSIQACVKASRVESSRVKAIGISYQMHGLVIVGQDDKPLRPSIIWCDSRSVGIGEMAFEKLGHEFCLQHYLNSPGNFTASKLRWVRENEPSVYSKIKKIMLPGEYVALKMTGELVTTPSGLSEGTFWDYPSNGLSVDLLALYDIDKELLPGVVPVFCPQGKLLPGVAKELGLSTETIVSYRAGDQPNNAFSLGVVNPGETAATAGTSGVIYTVTDKDAYDLKSRVNTFVHVSNDRTHKRNGVLVCVNGTGILNRWLKENLRGAGDRLSYDQMNASAQPTPIGADGLSFLPFGNGAERILQNKLIGASLHGLDLNRHHQGHLIRSSQEGIVFAMNYGFNILKGMGVTTNVIKAGNSNMFLSPLFREAFVNTTGAPLELYDTDGSVGAALGAGFGAGLFSSLADVWKGFSGRNRIEPTPALREKYLHSYTRWENILKSYL